jgi:hypothetical protein
MSIMLRSLQGFDTPLGFVPQGAEVDENDPVVKGREQLFETIPGSVVSKPTARKTAAKSPKAE